jgi:hypothetical protein
VANMSDRIHDWTGVRRFWGASSRFPLVENWGLGRL